jgi:hypothetical protein
MGTFYVRCKVENHVDRSKSIIVAKLLVDTGSDYTWVPVTSLARISHRLSATTADTLANTALRSVGGLDVLSSTPAAASVARLVLAASPPFRDDNR